jgi:GTPase involved in cell partitioning and DNA repair
MHLPRAAGLRGNYRAASHRQHTTTAKHLGGRGLIRCRATEMDVTMIGLQNAGKTSLLRVLAVSEPG